MRQLYFFWFIFSLMTAQAITWSSPQCLFTSDTADGIHPTIGIHATENMAVASWIAQDHEKSIYGTKSREDGWEPSNQFTDLSHIQSSMNLGVDSFDTYGFLKDLQPNEENEYLTEDPILIHAKIDNTPILCWQSIDGQLLRVDYIDGVASNPTVLYRGSTNTSFSCEQALFTTLSSVYAIDLFSLEKTLLFPRATREKSLAISAQGKQTAFIFQDLKSNFLLSAYSNEGKYIHSLIGTPGSSITNAKISISTLTGFLTAIWQMDNGQIQTAYFNGTRWGKTAILASNGESPSIAYNPITNSTIAVWADFTTNTIRASEFSELNWSDPTSISSVGSTIADPQIQINSQGNIFVIWSRKRAEDAKAIIEAITN